MPKKATLEDFQTVENNQQEYNCSVCKDTGIVYFVLESSFWRKKKVITKEPQTCYSCQPKI